jgi:DNA sulfur modification protein DndB
MTMNKWQVPCLRGVLGNWVFYSALMSSEQISRRVQTAKNIREAKALEDFLQRELKDRVKGIAQYLLKRENRFFNSIIVGVFDALPEWIQFDLGKAAKAIGMPYSEEIEDSLGLLVFSGDENMFAIDGQHRVEGIKLARQKSADTIKVDQYSVILVAHVDDKDGKIRTRRLFSDINKRAIPVSNGDKVVIDEDELNALVARRIYANYPHFKRGKLISITENERMPDGDTKHFTNLLTLYAVNKKLRKLFKKQRGLPEYALEQVEAFARTSADFYDFVIQHEPSYRRFFGSKTTTLAKERRNNRNLLFRPIGLVLLASLYAYFRNANNLDVLTNNLKRIKFTSPDGHFDRILWNEGRVEARAKNRKAAYELCLYLLGEQDRQGKENLLATLKEITMHPDYELPHPIL